MVGQFKPVTGVLRAGIGRFAPPGNSAGFCAAILRKHGAQSPLRLETLTYARPDRGEASAQQPPLVVNLLMQLRTCCDQSNTYLRGQAALNLQLTSQLRQALALSSGPVRAQAGAIQQAVQRELCRGGEFQRALEGLAREVKKNGGSGQALTARLPDPGSAAAASGERGALDGSAGTARQTLPVLRPPGPAGPEETRPQAAGSRRQTEAPMVHRSPAGKPAETSGQAEPARRKGQHGGKNGMSAVGADRRGEAAESSRPGPRGKSGGDRTRRAAGMLPAGEPAAQDSRALPEVRRPAGAKPPAQASPAGGQEMKQATQAVSPAKTEQTVQTDFLSDLKAGKAQQRDVPATAERAAQSLPVSVTRAGRPVFRDGDHRPRNRTAGEDRRPTLWRQAGRNFEWPHLPRPFSTVARSAMPTALQAAGSTANPLALYQLRYALPGRPAWADVPLTGRLVPSDAYPLPGRQDGPRRFHPQTAGTPAAGSISPMAPLGRSGLVRSLTSGIPGSAASLMARYAAAPGNAAPLRQRVPAAPGGVWSGSPAVSGVMALSGTGLAALPRMAALWRSSQPGLESAERPQGGRPGKRKRLVPGILRIAETAASGLSSGVTLAAAHPRPVRHPFSRRREPSPAGGGAVMARWAGLHRAPLWPQGFPTAGALALGRLDPRTAPGSAQVPAGGRVYRIPGAPAVFRGILSAGQTGRSGAAGGGLSAPGVLVEGGSASGAGSLQPAAKGLAKQLPAIREAARAAGIGEPFLQIQQSLWGLLNGRYRGQGAGVLSVPRRAASGEHGETAGPAALLMTGGQRASGAASGISERSGQGQPAGTRGVPRMIHRRPEHPAPAQGESGGDSGEAVLQAQTVGPARAAAMNAAYSYPPGSGTGLKPASPAEGLTAEQEARITQRVLEDINYSRMASEVLDRVERRLRAERRKFGR